MGSPIADDAMRAGAGRRFKNPQVRDRANTDFELR